MITIFLADSLFKYKILIPDSNEKEPLFSIFVVYSFHLVFLPCVHEKTIITFQF